MTDVEKATELIIQIALCMAFCDDEFQNSNLK